MHSFLYSVARYPFSLHHRDGEITLYYLSAHFIHICNHDRNSPDDGTASWQIWAELESSVPTWRPFWGSLRTPQRWDSSGDFSAWEQSNRKPFLSHECFGQVLHPPPLPHSCFPVFCLPPLPPPSPPFILPLNLYLLCKPGHPGPCFLSEWEVSDET